MTPVFSLLAYSLTFLVYSFSPKAMSSSKILATYIRGFKVIKLNGFNIKSSSSSNSRSLKGWFFNKNSFAFFNVSTSFNATLSFVVSAFFAIFSIRFSIISKSANINSMFMIYISLVGSTPPSTWIMFSSLKQRTTSTMASTSLI